MTFEICVTVVQDPWKSVDGVVCTTLGEAEAVVLPAPRGGEVGEPRQEARSLLLPEASDEIASFGEHVQ